MPAGHMRRRTIDRSENILQIAKKPFLARGHPLYGRSNICLPGHTFPVPPMPDTRLSRQSGLTDKPQLIADQLNSTSLKWGEDGELSELDLQRILRLLSQADPVAEALVAQVSEATN